MTKILIADPDIASRDLLSKALGTTSDLNVLATAPNGKICLDKIKSLHPDVVIAAAQLGDMDIVHLLDQMRSFAPDTGIIVVTSPDNEVQADLAVSALGKGAFDYLVKPCLHCTDEHIPLLSRLLAPKIRCFTIKRFSGLAKMSALPATRDKETVKPAVLAAPQKPVVMPAVNRPKKTARYRVVLIGVSTGGPEALTRMMPLFPKDFPLPIVIVLHMPKLFTGAMAKELDTNSAIDVSEAKDNENLLPGHAYLAPGGIHLVLEPGTRGFLSVKTHDGPAENGCKPAVDVLFRSAAPIVKEKAIGVILTGMGTDGTVGSQKLIEYNAPVLAQDEATSVVWGMPGSIVKAGLATDVLPLLQIPERIVSMVSADD